MSGLTPSNQKLLDCSSRCRPPRASCSPEAAPCWPPVSRPDQQRKLAIGSAAGQRTFVRLHLSGDGEVIVDIAIDAAAEHPPVVTLVGPTFDPEELAGRKLAALFGRAEARDFADVYVLARRFGKSVLLERAAEVDLGFDHRMLAQMMRTVDRFTDDEVPVAGREVDALRAYFRQWADELGGSPVRTTERTPAQSYLGVP